VGFVSLKRVLLLGSVLIGLGSSAMAGTSVSVFGVGNWLRTESAIARSQAALAYGAGAQIEFRKGASGLELGIMDLPAVQNHAQERFLRFYQIPVQLRVWANRMIGVGVGGYYAVGATGDALKALELQGHDYGLIGSLGVNLPLGAIGFLIEGRYQYGIANVAAPGNLSRHWRGAQILAGFRFGGQRRSRD
jgi:hypothetical protein